jgi:3-hydroxyisobutyrate dehydrogenase
MTTDKTTKVAILGLGLMGAGMARQLLAKGFDLSVWNRNPAKAEPLGAEGARIGATPAEAVRGAEIVVAMLSDDDASRTVWLGADGALAAMADGATAIECSTLSPAWVEELGAAAAARGIDLIDAPVTGSRANAEGGTLRFLAGGTPDIIERVRPALDAMGTETLLLGPPGSGALVKLINNFLCGVQSASLAEALVMAERSGLDIGRVAAVLTTGAPGSPHVKLMAERMMARDYRPNFISTLMVKDLTYAIQSFGAQGIQLRSGEAARDRHAAAATHYVDTDISVVIEPIRQNQD